MKAKKLISFKPGAYPSPLKKPTIYKIPSRGREPQSTGDNMAIGIFGKDNNKPYRKETRNSDGTSYMSVTSPDEIAAKVARYNNGELRDAPKKKMTPAEEMQLKELINALKGMKNTTSEGTTPQTKPNWDKNVGGPASEEMTEPVDNPQEEMTEPVDNPQEHQVEYGRKLRMRSPASIQEFPASRAGSMPLGNGIRPMNSNGSPPAGGGYGGIDPSTGKPFRTTADIMNDNEGDPGEPSIFNSPESRNPTREEWAALERHNKYMENHPNEPIDSSSGFSTGGGHVRTPADIMRDNYEDPGEPSIFDSPEARNPTREEWAASDRHSRYRENHPNEPTNSSSRFSRGRGPASFQADIQMGPTEVTTTRTGKSPVTSTSGYDSNWDKKLPADKIRSQRGPRKLNVTGLPLAKQQRLLNEMRKKRG